MSVDPRGLLGIVREQERGVQVTSVELLNETPLLRRQGE